MSGEYYKITATEDVAMSYFGISEQRGDMSDGQLAHMDPRGCYVLKSALDDGRPELASVIGRRRFLPSARRMTDLDITYGLVRPRSNETFGALNLTEPE